MESVEGSLLSDSLFEIFVRIICSLSILDMKMFVISFRAEF